MSLQRKIKTTRARDRTSQFCYQNNLLTSKVKEEQNDSKDISEHEQSGSDDSEQTEEQIEEDFQIAVKYFEKDPMENKWNRDRILGKHLKSLENMAQKNGLPPEEMGILLNVVLSGKFGTSTNTRIFKCLIPATLISEDSVVKAVSWLCVGKCSGSTKVLFYRWLVTMFDFIDHKEQINLLYGFFFASLQDDKLCPYVCHLLYLLTKKENVKPFRVRKVLDLQAKMGMKPHLQALLSLYKYFSPALVSVSVPIRKKIYFKNSENLWKTALLDVRQRNQRPSPEPLNLLLGSSNVLPKQRKRKSHSFIPQQNCSSCSDEYGKKSMSLSKHLGSKEPVRIEQLRSFPQLLQNIHCLELPSHMGAALKNSLLLHYINCARDESILLRFYYWLSQTLQEACLSYKVNNYGNEKEFTDFLDTILKAECFLQEGFCSCETFLYKNLPLWDGLYCQSQFLQLISWTPFSNFSELKPLIFDHLAQIFFTSSICVKCSILQSLKELLQNWLLWLSMDIHTKLTSSPL
ncbi:centromere protein I [Sorex fumeus]|uniref:centromere protein I n=1 Tax=Sorex fumeus TaxID=62283 RepID=UPI0024ADEAC4|nr:centromere protein I [Sorex fumeus]